MIKLRGHHLYTLASLATWGVHKSKFRKKIIRNLKIFKLKLLGYEKSRQMAEGLIDSVLLILEQKVDSVKIVDSHDIICDSCQQKGGEHCRVGGKKMVKKIFSFTG
jgi:hypothetical protein